MNITIFDICGAVFIGVGATLLIDLWALFLERFFNIASLNFCLVGRWFGHMSLGTFTHAHIAKASKRPAECALGWAVHYVTGIVFALVLVMSSSSHWFAQPQLLPAVLVGMGSVIFPFFIMQPALGFGFAAAKSPKPFNARFKSLMTHFVFGLGLYLFSLLLKVLVSVFA